VLSAEGPVSFQPGTLPKEFHRLQAQALKARISSGAFPKLKRAFSADLGSPQILERCPKLPMDAAHSSLQ
jgi:hypothetical protein